MIVDEAEAPPGLQPLRDWQLHLLLAARRTHLAGLRQEEHVALRTETHVADLLGWQQELLLLGGGVDPGEFAVLVGEEEHAVVNFDGVDFRLRLIEVLINISIDERVDCVIRPNHIDVSDSRVEVKFRLREREPRREPSNKLESSRLHFEWWS